MARLRTNLDFLREWAHEAARRLERRTFGRPIEGAWGLDANWQSKPAPVATKPIQVRLDASEEEIRELFPDAPHLTCTCGQQVDKVIEFTEVVEDFYHIEFRICKHCVTGYQEQLS